MERTFRQELDAAAYLSVTITDNLAVFILPACLKPNYPAIIEAIGLMRKKAFAVKGAGGKDKLDLDRFDEAYHQMFVIKLDSMEMVAGYRFYVHRNTKTVNLDMARLFDVNGLLGTAENLPSIELGRSFVIPKYQKYGEIFFSLFSGLGVIVNLIPETKYLFGKITFYPGNPHNEDVLYFLETYHRDKRNLVVPRNAVKVKPTGDFQALSYHRAFKKVKDYMPEILKIYLKLTRPEFAVVSGTAPNPEFGEGIMETAFRIYYPRITEFWKKRFVYPCHAVAEKISVPTINQE